jgi:DNA-directed RNA polymerase subunit RPC12/RpoP
LAERRITMAKKVMVIFMAMVFIVSFKSDLYAMTWEEFWDKYVQLTIEKEKQAKFSNEYYRIEGQHQQLQQEYYRSIGVEDTNGNGKIDDTERQAQTYKDSRGRVLLNGTSAPAPKPAHTHEYGEGAVTREPTCAEEGVMTYTCTTCGATKKEAIEKLPHTYESAITIEPTCTERGERLYTCIFCGATVTRDIPMLGHRNKEWVLYSLPTCTEYGVDELVCADCGHHIEIRQVEPLGHVEGDWVLVTPRTYTAEGYFERYCTVCDALLATGTVPPDTEGLKRAVLVSGGIGAAVFGVGVAGILVRRRKMKKETESSNRE